MEAVHPGPQNREDRPLLSGVERQNRGHDARRSTSPRETPNRLGTAGGLGREGGNLRVVVLQAR